MSIKINKYMGTKLRRLSFLLAVMVVLIHAESLRGVEFPTGLAKKFHEVLDFFIWSPVAIFFMISGWFFSNSEYMLRGGYCSFICKKCRTLVVPYLIFSIYGVVITTPVLLVVNHAKGLPWYDRTIFSGESVFQWLDTMFGVTVTSPLNNGPLWYVHSLIGIFLLAPVWRFIANKLSCLILLVPIIICQVMNYDMVNTVVPIFNIRYLAVWFFVGMVLSRLPKNIIEPAKRCLIGVALSGIFVVLLKADVNLFRILQFWSPLVQFAFLWLAYDCIFDRNETCEIHEFVGLSFWIYCVHAPISNFIIPVGHYLLGESSIALCLTTCINIVVMLSLSIVSGLCIKHKFPKFFALLTGGRQ